MSYPVKSILTATLVMIQYTFTTIVYPHIMEKYTLMQADQGTKAFQGMQMWQFIYSYLWILLVILGYSIWHKDIKDKFFEQD